MIALKKIISLMLCGIVAATAFMFGSMTTDADETVEPVTYTVQDIRNLQDFLLVRLTKENLAGKSYDLNHDGIWNVFDLCLMKRACLNQQNEETKINIDVNGHTLTAVLSDNSSAQAFTELLKNGSVTIEMSNYGNFEKVGTLPETLPRNDERITTEAGDLILYQGNQITIYYDENTWNFTRLGKLENITQAELNEILGDGSVTAIFSLAG